MAGVGAAYMDSDDDLFPYSSRSDWQVTGDLSMDMGGWNLMGSISVGDSRESSGNNPWGFELSGGAYVAELVQAVPSASNIRYHCKINESIAVAR